MSTVYAFLVTESIFTIVSIVFGLMIADNAGLESYSTSKTGERQLIFGICWIVGMLLGVIAFFVLQDQIVLAYNLVF